MAKNKQRKVINLQKLKKFSKMVKKNICKKKVMIYKFQLNYKKEKVKVKFNLKCLCSSVFYDMQTKFLSWSPKYQKVDLAVL